MPTAGRDRQERVGLAEEWGQALCVSLAHGHTYTWIHPLTENQKQPLPESRDRGGREVECLSPGPQGHHLTQSSLVSTWRAASPLDCIRLRDGIRTGSCGHQGLLSQGPPAALCPLPTPAPTPATSPHVRPRPCRHIGGV